MWLFTQKILFVVLSGYNDNNNKARSLSRSLDWATTVLVGKHAHQEQIRQRLTFLAFLVETSADGFYTDNAHWGQIWDLVVVDTLTPEERDFGLQWFTNLATGKVFPFFLPPVQFVSVQLLLLFFVVNNYYCRLSP